MKLFKVFIISVLTVAFPSCDRQSDDLHFGGWEYDWMKHVKVKLERGDRTFLPAYERLIENADKVLEGGVYSVTFKELVPPGGSINDYMSMGPYWWPDPDKPDGLPYIRRDGEINPESYNLDRPQVGGLINDVRTLSLAWFFSGQTRYASKASELLRVWFLEPETLMNPHLKYGQAIPGRTEGRGIGIIDTKGFNLLVDAITLLETSGELSREEQNRIRTWFGEYFQWLTESQLGIDEDNTPNNHATAYDVQVCAIAYFLGNKDFVIRKIEEMPRRRIDPMIEEDGRQPLELRRTIGYGYSVSNLSNYFEAAELGHRVGVDNFNYVSPKGGSLIKALDYLIGYIGHEEDFPYDQISAWEPTENRLGLLIRRAAKIYQNDDYQSIWEDVFCDRVKTHWSLLTVSGK